MAGYWTASQGWEEPRQLIQGELFTRPRDKVLAMAGVTTEEMDDCRAFGWISYDVRDLAVLDTATINEMALVRNLARSGLSRAQVSALLEELPKPYRYDPLRVAYCFGHGWVELPTLPGVTERDEYMESHIDAWLSRLELLQDRRMLKYLSARTMQAVIRLPARTEEEAEGSESSEREYP